MYEPSAEELIATAFRWDKHKVNEVMRDTGLLRKCNKVAFGIKRSYGSSKGLWDVDIVLRSSYCITRHDMYLSKKMCMGLKECWKYIRLLAGAMWFFTDNYRITKDNAEEMIPTHLLFKLQEGQMAIVVNEFDTYMYTMRNLHLIRLNHITEVEKDAV